MQKKLKRILKSVFKLARLLFLVATMWVTGMYMLAPVYKFEPTKPFSGDKIYNPYQGIENLKPFKANFHAHSVSWFEVTDGVDSAMGVYERYKDLGYDIIELSNYQHIEDCKLNPDLYLPTYEHGYNIFKAHQLIINAQRVTAYDLPFYQTLSQKQYIIKLLNDDAGKDELISLNHPLLMDGYTVKDLKHLTGYNCFEAMSKNLNSVIAWDTALSNGHYSTIIANDDSHDAQNPNLTGVCFTMVYLDKLDKNEILKALKEGRTYGVDMYPPHNETFERRKVRLAELPNISYIRFEDNKLSVKVDSQVEKIKFIGQNGKIMDSIVGKDSAEYIFKANDTYIRTEIELHHSRKFMLNPLYRTNGENISKFVFPQINIWATIIYELCLALVFILLLYFVFIYRTFWK